MTSDKKLYPESIELFKNFSESLYQTINVIDLFLDHKETYLELEHRQRQLVGGEKQRLLLINNMAHQVSRPIVELKQSSYILSHRGFTKDAYRGFRGAMTEIERGARNFINFEILAEDTEDEKTDIYIRDSFDILEIVETAHKRIKPYLEVRFLKIDIETNERSIPNLHANKEAILECLLNVYHNAIKYSLTQRSVEVDVKYNKRVKEVEVRVSNYGIELPVSDWEEIFKPTIRGETVKQVTIERSGIGLYITRGFLSIHGGTIKVESCTPCSNTKDGTKYWKTTFLIVLDI